MTPVTDAKGNQIDFDAAVELMDDEIREDMSNSYEPGFDNPQVFIEEYSRRHTAKFGGEAFAPYAGGAW